MIELRARNLTYEKQNLNNPIIINISNLPIFPLFSLDIINYSISIQDLQTNNANYYNKEALANIFIKHGVPLKYIHVLSNTLRQLISCNKKDRLIIREKTFGRDFDFKTYLTSEKKRLMHSFTDIIYRNISNIIEGDSPEVFLNKVSYFGNVGNNIRLLGEFFRDSSTFSCERNFQKLQIHRHSIFQYTDEGVFPLLIVGYDKGTLPAFKGSLLKCDFSEDVIFSNMKAYFDCDWFLSSTNKVLKSTIIKKLEDKFPGIGIVLFDGKKFANENMFTYLMPSFKTLAKQKEYYRNLEKDFIKSLETKYIATNFNLNIETFYKTYKEFLEKSKEVKEEKPISGVITEERALTQEDIDMINSLMIETTGDALLSESFPESPLSDDDDEVRLMIDDDDEDEDTEHVRINLEANGIDAPE